MALRFPEKTHLPATCRGPLILKTDWHHGVQTQRRWGGGWHMTNPKRDETGFYIPSVVYQHKRRLSEITLPLAVILEFPAL